MTRLGLITDIHEDVENLQRALLAFDREGVDRIICLGDVFDTGERLEEVAAVLAAQPVEGLWGNHDFGLCWQPDERLDAKYSAAVLSHFRQYRPSMTVEDCFFSHVPAHRDPYDLLGLWDTGGWQASLGSVALSFAARSERVLFMGHHHRWVIAMETGPVEWPACEPMHLSSPQRFLVMLGAACDGWCAIYDTQAAVLTPIELADELAIHEVMPPRRL